METLFTANAIPITPSNKLRLAFWNGGRDSGYTVLCRFQIQNKDGSISENAETFAVPASANNVQFFINLAYGNLLAVTLTTFGTILQSGELYAAISLQYGSVNDNTQQLPLISGYVLANAPLSYPLGETHATNSGEPAALSVQPADPGAGSNINYLCEATSRTVVTAGAFGFNASAVPAVRTFTVRIADQIGEYWNAESAQTLAAGTSKTVILTRLPLPIVIPADVIYLPLPWIQPLQTLAIFIDVANIDAGDTWGTRFLALEQRVAI